jgi:electron transfer flavoprotein alpha subunit
MSKGILVVIEQHDGALNRTWLESLAAAQLMASGLSEEVSAIVPGKGASLAASEVAKKKIKQIYLLEHDKLATYTPDGYVAALKEAVSRLDPSYVIFSHTYQTRDYAPRLAAALKRPLISDCIGFKVEGRQVIFTRQIFQGKLNTDVRAQSGPPILASFQAGSFRADQAEAAAEPPPIEELEVNISGVQIRTQSEEKFQEAKQAVDLTQAERIVAVGRGIKDKENLPLVEELARELSAELAASRPICDNEWLPMDRQIGSSGQTVAPKLYLAVGISGAIQHVVGMKNSQVIVAINKDPEAPIFDIADYGIVGDLFEVVPALIAELRKIKGETK